MIRAGPASANFVSQRTRLHYADWGNSGAPLLLFLHGSRDHCRSWDWIASEFRDDWHIVAPDLRGHGDSAWSPEGRYEFASYVYDLAQLIVHLDAGTVTIVAHSLGAHIALRYAGLYPEMVERLVAVEAVGAPPDVAARRGGLAVDVRMRDWIAEKRAAAGRLPRRYAAVEDALARMRMENDRLTRPQAEHLTRHGLARAEDGLWTWKFDNHLRVWPFPDIGQEELEILWRRITCPTLLLYGKESWPSDVPAVLARNLANASVVEMTGAGHWPHHDQPEHFIAELRAFLAALSGGAGPR